MSSTDVLTAVRAALETIADAFDSVEFATAGEDRAASQAAGKAVVETIRKYLLPRLREPDAPVVAALVGLSGVGKSTIVNSLAQEAVSSTGVVRPTTRTSVLWAHRDHAARYWTEFVGRVRDQVGTATDVVIGDDPMTRYLTIIDTPPLEMAGDEGAAGAAEVLMFADICVFVTSSDRYADAAPLRFLEAARSRGIPILFVLNRLPSDAADRRALLEDFAVKLVDAGMLPVADPGFVFGVGEAGELRRHGGLDLEAVAALRRELSAISDPELRLMVVDQTTEATVGAVLERAGALVDEVRSEAETRRRLLDDVRRSYAEAAAGFRRDLEAGRFAPLSAHEAWARVASDLAGVVTRAAGVAAEETAEAWSQRPGGARLLESGHEGLRRHGPQAVEVSRAHLDRWLGAVEDIVRRGRRRIGHRALRRASADLWRSVLNPEHVSRRWAGDRAAAVGEARHLLAEAAAAALDVDAGRFARRFGPEIPDGLADRVAEAVAYLDELPEGDALVPAGGGDGR